MDELKTLFILGGDSVRRIRQFRDERLREIDADLNTRPLMGGGRLILHIVPLATATSPWQVDLENVFKMNESFRPIDHGGCSPRFNFEGFINERNGSVNWGYTQVFRNGALEATKAGIIRERDGRKYIHGHTFEKCIFDVFSSYINGLRDVGVPPPLVVLITLQGVKGIPYWLPENIWVDYGPAIERDILYLPECIINEYGQNVDYQQAMKPAFDALWNSAGRASAKSFAEDGRWIDLSQSR